MQHALHCAPFELENFVTKRCQTIIISLINLKIDTLVRALVRHDPVVFGVRVLRVRVAVDVAIGDREFDVGYWDGSAYAKMREGS